MIDADDRRANAKERKSLARIAGELLWRSLQNYGNLAKDARALPPLFPL